MAQPNGWPKLRRSWTNAPNTMPQTLFAKITGTVSFHEGKAGRTYVSVMPAAPEPPLAEIDRSVLAAMPARHEVEVLRQRELDPIVRRGRLRSEGGALAFDVDVGGRVAQSAHGHFDAKTAEFANMFVRLHSHASGWITRNHVTLAGMHSCSPTLKSIP
mgnify:CR=1 FL=1